MRAYKEDLGLLPVFGGIDKFFCRAILVLRSGKSAGPKPQKGGANGEKG